MTAIGDFLKFVDDNKVSLALVGSLFANVFLAMKWFIERQDKKEVIHRIKPTFFSLFGRYELENMNVYTRNAHGEFVGRTINDIPERDTYFKVQPVVRGFVYRIVPERSDDRLIVFLRRTPSDKRRLVNFNIVG